MAFPEVIIKILNMMRGPIAGVEQHFLFMGYGTVTGNERHLIMVDRTTDLDKVLENADDDLKKTMKSAQLNGKQGWTAGVMIIDKGDDWKKMVFKANETSSFEATVLNWPATDKTLIESAAAMREELKAKLGRETFVLLTTPAIDVSVDKGQTWGEWLTATTAIQNGTQSQYVSVVPQVHKTQSTIGVCAGRLANKEVSIADTIARVKTGGVIGSTDLAVDKNGAALELATLRALEASRFSVPMWYPDYQGQYWTTGRTLDVAGGDYQDLRHIRVVMKAARKVRVRAIANIGNREFNSTPGSIANFKNYFMQDIREMAVSTMIGNYEFPGEVKPPRDEDITITWINDEEVEILIAVTPYECPVKITAAIMINKRMGA